MEGLGKEKEGVWEKGREMWGCERRGEEREMESGKQKGKDGEGVTGGRRGTGNVREMKGRVYVRGEFSNGMLGTFLN